MHCRPQNCPNTLLKDPAYLALGIFQISEYSGAGWAGLHAGRLPALFHPVMTPAAFIRFIYLVVDKPGAIGTGLNAISTPEAIIIVNQHETFGRLVSCADGADLHAGRVLAVVTHFGHEKRLYRLFLKVFADRPEPFRTAFWRVDINAIFGDDVPFHPGSKCALGYVVFLGARTHATAPPNALADIDNIGPVVFGAPLLPYPGCPMAATYPRRIYHQGCRRTRYNLFQKYPS